MKATLIDATASEGVLHFRWIPPLSSHRWKVIIKLTQTGEESTQPERELTGMYFMQMTAWLYTTQNTLLLLFGKEIQFTSYKSRVK